MRSWRPPTSPLGPIRPATTRPPRRSASSVARSGYRGWANASPLPATAEHHGYDRLRSCPAPLVCGRYTLTTRRSDGIQARLAETLGVEGPPPDSGLERFNIAPTQEVLAVVDDRDGRRVQELRWGLVPHWAKELNTRFSMINARRDARPAARVPPPRRGVGRSLPDPGRRLVRVAAPRGSAPAEAAAALLAHRRRAVLLRRPLDALDRARRSGGPQLHDHHLRGERAGPAAPRPHAGRSSPTRSSGSPGYTPRSTARPRASCSRRYPGTEWWFGQRGQWELGQPRGT
jgi:hypothetical protein